MLTVDQHPGSGWPGLNGDHTGKGLQHQGGTLAVAAGNGNDRFKGVITGSFNSHAVITGTQQVALAKGEGKAADSDLGLRLALNDNLQ